MGMHRLAPEDRSKPITYHFLGEDEGSTTFSAYFLSSYAAHARPVRQGVEGFDRPKNIARAYIAKNISPFDTYISPPEDHFTH